MSTESLPVRYGAIIFPGFQLLDICGPLDALNILSTKHRIDLSIISHSVGPVSTAFSTEDGIASTASQSLIATHSFSDAPEDLEVVLIPGGYGCRRPEMEEIREYIRKICPSLKYIISICTGSVVLAQAGVLDGKKATSNKTAWSWVLSQGPKVDWIAKARWVKDGRFYTASGISAGMDGFLQFIEDVYGKQVAAKIAQDQEYRRETDSSNDPFAEAHGLQ